MKNTRGFVLGLVLGLGLALSGVGLAQTVTQNDKKEGASCCAMSCCSGDSCSMMKHDAKNPSAKELGCCGGDSCSMMKHDAKMNHDSQNHESKGGCCCCSGDSCNMNMKDMKEKPKGN